MKDERSNKDKIINQQAQIIAETKREYQKIHNENEKLKKCFINNKNNNNKDSNINKQQATATTMTETTTADTTIFRILIK